jgi:hypothetical protein
MIKKYVVLIFIVCSLHSAAQQTVGLFTQDPGSLDGYVLFAPITSNNTYLIDKCGYLVHTWTSTHHPGQSVYFLEDGTLLRSGSTNNTVFTSGGNGGIIEKFSWNSTLTWSYLISSATECQHHDIRQLPNGNVLAIVWELKTNAEAIAAGRNPATVGTTLWSEKIVEVQQTGINTGNIVWEWHVWDHLVQEYDATKSNYGNISQHPELLNLNYTGGGTNVDWLHCNSIDYNESLDQILISSHNLGEVWVIDHSTTTAEAASHAGGVHAKGGDFLYRWGNPIAYNRGTQGDKKLFGQHNAHWIENGMTDGGKIMIFNNGMGRPAGNYSSIDIINTPVDGSGNYSIPAVMAYQPDTIWWTYEAPVPTDFYSTNISGAQRLSNGNTIICEGPQGIFFEIDSSKSTVWRYVNPVNQAGPISQGSAAVQNLVFRCSLYEPSFPGFTGQTLTPGNPIELNPLSYTCTMITGIEEQDMKPGILPYPNPFTKQIHLPSKNEYKYVELLNCFGQIIYKGYEIEAQDFSKLSEGIYFLRIINGHQISSVKLIHQK